VIAHLLDHTVSVWRPTQDVRGKLRQVDQAWTRVVAPAANNAAVQHRGGIIADRRSGEITEGVTMVYMDAAGPDDGDVVKVESGPNAPALLRVGRAYSPFLGAPLHLTCETWKGEDPATYALEPW
jgi:hypothetical protein